MVGSLQDLRIATYPFEEGTDCFVLFLFFFFFIYPLALACMIRCSKMTGQGLLAS